MWHSRIIFY
jgi:hypothetical protein